LIWNYGCSEGTGAKVLVAMSLPSRVFCMLTVYKKKAGAGSAEISITG